MTSELMNEIDRRARITAAGFVEEFGEPLDSSETDWDATAWEEDSRGLDLGDDDYYGEAWNYYVNRLEEETHRLCTQYHGSYPVQ